MTRWWVLAIPLVASAVHAQTQVPVVATRPRTAVVGPLAPSSYCLGASAAFLESETKAFDELKNCTRGDTIVIPAKSPNAVARMCDFTKAIVTTPEHVVCVLVIPERVSK